MAHLKQKQISDNSCKAIIIDTLLEAVRPLTQEELSREITSLFHILVSAERLKQQIHALSLEGAILLDEDDYLRISPSKQPDFIIARLKETTLRKEATIIWLDNLRTQQELSSELEKVLSQALPIFLRSLFVKHGVLSYDAALWHDAYNFAYVQKMQKADAKNAIDTRCLFLTTDQALTSFQREDHEAKNTAPVVIAPSQLLQMFAFSTTDSGYEETFIKFFASSSLGATFKYNNDDIQEILSRIGHYNGVSVKIAERILARELVSSRYFSATDEEKEEIIYNSVSDELLLELNLTKEQVTLLESQNTKLDNDCNVALQLLTENEEQFAIERLKLQSEAAEADRQRGIEEVARKKAEKVTKEATEYSAAQEELYADEKMEHWIKVRRWVFWLGIVLTIAVIGLSIFLWIHYKDSGCLSLLSALAIPLFIIPVGAGAYSPKVKSEQRQQILDAYHQKLKR